MCDPTGGLATAGLMIGQQGLQYESQRQQVKHHNKTMAINRNNARLSRDQNNLMIGLQRDSQQANTREELEENTLANMRNQAAAETLQVASGVSGKTTDDVLSEYTRQYQRAQSILYNNEESAQFQMAAQEYNNEAQYTSALNQFQDMRKPNLYWDFILPTQLNIASTLFTGGPAGTPMPTQPTALKPKPKIVGDGPSGRY